MTVYRITHQKYAEQLSASGIANRWNLDGQFVIYTASSRSLACLENLVYTSGETLGSGLYVCLEIIIQDTDSISTITQKDIKLIKAETKTYMKKTGSEWYLQNNHLLMIVPSVIIPHENNIIINTRHPEFKNIKINSNEPFIFDKRFLSCY